MAAATGVVSARDLLAAASERSSAIDYKSDDLTYDMGLMAAFDAHPVDPAQFAKDPEATLLEVARDNAQLLVKKIFELPVSMTEVGPVADLPDRQMRLPRWKPVPKGKALTRWDKFALSKGIEKKKRGRMIWDEAEQEWKPRYGFKRGKDDTHDWAIPVKAGDDPYADPFEQRDLKKKERVIKNKLAHVKNVERATKASNRKKFGDSDAGAAAPAVSIEGAAAAAGGKGRKGKALKSGSGALVAPRVRLSATAGVGSIPSGIPARLGSHSGLGRDAGAVAASAGGHKAKRRRLTEEGGAAAGGGRAGSGMGVREGKGVKHDRLKSAQVGTASMGRVSYIELPHIYIYAAWTPVRLRARACRR